MIYLEDKGRKRVLFQANSDVHSIILGLIHNLTKVQLIFNKIALFILLMEEAIDASPLNPVFFKTNKGGIEL